MSWKAKWIWIDREDPKNYYLYARKTFEASPKDVEKAEMKITADSKYVLFINGHFIGSGPIRGWPFEYYYDVYDIKPYLVEGRNVIAVIAQYYGISSLKSLYSWRSRRKMEMLKLLEQIMTGKLYLLHHTGEMFLDLVVNKNGLRSMMLGRSW